VNKTVEQCIIRLGIEGEVTKKPERKKIFPESGWWREGKMMRRLAVITITEMHLEAIT